MSSICKNCGTVIRGRVDKKYCDDSCRSSYHNNKYGNVTQTMRSTHRLLRRNWKILAHYYNNGATEVPYGLLHSEGFIPEYVTGVIVNESTVKYRCYEYTFEIDNEGCIHIDAGNEEGY